MLPTPSQRAWSSIPLRKEATPVAKVMKCFCGSVIRGETDDDIVTNVQKHAREVHDMEVTKEQVLSMARQE
jgi:predicted small metal-binding protein